MKRILIALVVVALIGLGFWSFSRKKTEQVGETPSVSETSGGSPSAGTGGSTSGAKTTDDTAKPGSVPTDGTVAPGQTTGTAPVGTVSGTTPKTGTPSPVASGAVTPSSGAGVKTPAKPAPKDGVDGNVAELGDDGDLPPMPKKAPLATTPAGVKSAKVYLVASDLRELPNVTNVNRPFEAGISEGSKATPWKNRVGTKSGDGIRVKGNGTATFVPGLATAYGPIDAVALCAPGAKECVNTQATQLKVGPDVNHADHWLSGPDKKDKSSKGGSSFTVLFVAARASANGNPLLEHQNGEAGASKGPFLGWIGPDLVGSIHGSQGVVGVSAVAIPSVAPSGVVPQIFTLRFDRKKEELRLFVVGEKNSETSAVTLAAGEGPDNNEYAAIAMGSKNPGAGAATYVFEQATFSRSLTDAEICSIHKDWNQKYGLKISTGKLKPCAE